MLLQSNVCGQYNLFKDAFCTHHNKKENDPVSKLDRSDQDFGFLKKKQGYYFFSLWIIYPQNNYRHQHPKNILHALKRVAAEQTLLKVLDDLSLGFLRTLSLRE